MLKEKRFLHIASDEKFINSAYAQFEKSFPKSNIFKIYTNEDNYKIKHVSQDVNFDIININNLDIGAFIEGFEKYDLVLFHGLSIFQSRLIINAPKSTKILWFFWGGEIYNHPYEPLGDIYGQKTRKVFKIKTTSNYYINLGKTVLRPLKYKFLLKRLYFDNLNAIKRVNYVSTQFKEDFNNLLSKNLIRKDAVNVKFTYYPLEIIFKNEVDQIVNNNNILLGNSASETNNHLEAFDLLKDLNLKNRKIITPLSYGNMNYAGEIINTGNRMFSNNFKPLTEFLKLNEYNTIIQQCGITIMNNYRQQAIGNIMAMIWMGSKVYLDERNTVYRYLKRLGVIVFSINKDLIRENKDVFKLLTQSEIENNRNILKIEIGESNLLKTLKNQINSIFEHE